MKVNQTTEDARETKPASSRPSEPALRRPSSLFRWALFFCDAALLSCGFLFAHWIRFFSGIIPLVGPSVPPLRLYLPVFSGGTLLGMAALLAAKRYSAGRTDGRLIWALGGMYGALFLAFFALKAGAAYSRTTLFLAAVLHPALLGAGRLLLLRAFRAAAAIPPSVPVITAGDTRMLQCAGESLTAENGFRLVERLNRGDGEGTDRLCDDIHAALERHGQPGLWLVISPLSMKPESFGRVLVDCEKHLVDLKLAFCSQLLAHADLEAQKVGKLWLVGLRVTPLSCLSNRILKRALDVIGAAVGLALGGPVALLGGLLVRLESRGPVFHAQRRLGLNAQEFTLHKVRSMIPGAEDETGPTWATREDPRRTRVGTLLRRFSIDEIPQFWNVLKGEMSLVGPRPERACFVNQFREDYLGYMTRHRVKPGMTGWAQVHGLRGNTSVEKRRDHDLHYLRHWSIFLDLRILLASFAAVLRGQGAC